MTGCDDRPTVMAFYNAYLPGLKAGGPISSLRNLVERLGDEVNFRIVTGDRDLGDTTPFTTVRPETWTRIGKAQVFYLSPKAQNLRYLKELVNATKPDSIYFKSLWHPVFTIKPLLLRRRGMISPARTIVAPCGTLAGSALRTKWLKKMTYLKAAKAMGLYRDVLWHAASNVERTQIERYFGSDVATATCPCLADPSLQPTHRGLRKCQGELRLVTVARIHPIKNLDFTIRVLQRVQGRVRLTIYGPVEDGAYWRHCQELMKLLPDNVTVEYRGPTTHKDLAQHLGAHDVFILPTKGEAFGNSILEALQVGLPALISDQTPWRGLEQKGAGWDLPLSRPLDFRRVLECCVAMTAEELSMYSRRACSFVADRVRDSKSLAFYREMFQHTRQARLGRLKVDSDEASVRLSQVHLDGRFVA